MSTFFLFIQFWCCHFVRCIDFFPYKCIRFVLIDLFEQKRLEDVSIPTHLDKSDDPRADSAPEVCIDAGSTGNIARFINHSCQPNLFVQCVLSTHHDIKLARVVLFAADNIPPQKIL